MREFVRAFVIMFGLGASILGAAIIAFPLAAAGTLDPCLAAVRVMVHRDMPELRKGPMDPTSEAVGQTLAITVGAEYMRRGGTRQCYGILAKVMRNDAGLYGRKS